jgi:hypothetical protein
MNKSLLVLLVALAFPVVTFVYFFLTGATIAFVHNAGPRDTEISMVIADGNSFERTPDKPLKAGHYTWVIFYPHTQGDLSVTCLKDGHWKGFSIGHDAPKRFSASGITLASCDRLTSLRRFAG